MNHEEAVDTLAAERYVLGEMEGRERDAFEEHFFSCTECGDNVRSVALMGDGTRVGLMDDSRASRTAAAGAPGPPRRRAGSGWRPAIAIPWAAAATLALVAGYESVHTRSQPRQTPIALAPITIRPISRGQPQVLPVRGDVVTLAVALDGIYQGSLRYELSRADSTVVGSAEVAAPPAGAPLLLMIPSDLLNSAGNYTLRVKNPGSTDLISEEYRFTVVPR